MSSQQGRGTIQTRYRATLTGNALAFNLRNADSTPKWIPEHWCVADDLAEYTASRVWTCQDGAPAPPWGKLITPEVFLLRRDSPNLS
jgi:hypothetical protein